MRSARDIFDLMTGPLDELIHVVACGLSNTQEKLRMGGALLCHTGISDAVKVVAVCISLGQRNDTSLD
jgi:hypothetical protein